MFEHNGPPIYTYHLQPKLRSKLVKLLDIGNNEYLNLAHEIPEITPDEIHVFKHTARCGGSPSEVLFDFLDRRKKTVVFLYEKLVVIGHKRAADELECFVPPHLRRDKEEDHDPNIPRGDQDEQSACSLVPPHGEDYSNIMRRNYSRDPTSLDISTATYKKPVLGSHESWRQNSSIAYQHERMQQYEYKRMNDNLASMHQPKAANKSVITGIVPAYHGRQPIESQDQDTSGLVTDWNKQPSNHLSGDSSSSSSSNSNNVTPPASKLSNSTTDSLAGLLQKFSYDSIKIGTNDFGDNYCIGSGAFGKVYRGTIKKTTFAIKVFSEGILQNDEASQRHVMNEIEALSKVRHKNIVQLCGFCDQPSLCLVYEYMINGSLRDKLACKGTAIDQKKCKPLTWTQRSNILRGTARGLFYLHASHMVHGDIKSSNILLDQDFQPKISDFGLAKAITAENGATGLLTHVTRKTATQNLLGSRAFLPEEYIRTRKYNLMTDVFSFGVVIYQVCTTRPAQKTKGIDVEFLYEVVEEANNIYETEKDEVTLMKLKDPDATDWPDGLWLRVIRLGTMCCGEKKLRPKMEKVLELLEQIEVDNRKKKNTDDDDNVKQNGKSSMGSVREKRESFQGSGAGSLLKDPVSLPHMLQQQYDIEKEKQEQDKPQTDNVELKQQEHKSEMMTQPKAVDEVTAIKAALGDGQQNAYRPQVPPYQPYLVPQMGVYMEGDHIREAPTEEGPDNGFWGQPSANPSSEVLSRMLTANDLNPMMVRSPPAIISEQESDKDFSCRKELDEMVHKRTKKKMTNLLERDIRTGPGMYPYIQGYNPTQAHYAPYIHVPIVEPPIPEYDYQAVDHIDQKASLQTMSSQGSNVTVKESSAGSSFGKKCLELDDDAIVKTSHDEKETNETNVLLPHIKKTPHNPVQYHLSNIPYSNVPHNTNTGQVLSETNIPNMQIPRQSDYAGPPNGSVGMMTNQIVTDSSLPNYYLPAPASQMEAQNLMRPPDISATGLTKQTPPSTEQTFQYSRSMSPRIHLHIENPVTEMNKASQHSSLPSQSSILSEELKEDSERVTQAEDLTKRFQAMGRQAEEISNTSEPFTE